MHEGETGTGRAAPAGLGRRRFLGLVAAGVGGVALGACSSDDDASPTTTAGRSTASTTTTRPAAVPQAPGIDADPFTLGVASGDPLPGSVILWTRLAPEPVDPSGTGGLGDADHRVLWEVAADESFATVVASGVADAPAAHGHSVHAEAGGLHPDTWYWYRFRTGRWTSPVGRTRTTPAVAADVAKLRLAFASCQLRPAGHWTSYDHLVDDDLDAVFFLGDYIYEYPGGTGDLAVPLDDEPRDLADYRVLYAGYKRDPKLQAAHAVAPWVVTWDDHEVENNYAADHPERAADQAAFPARRKAAYHAFWEHHPLRVDPPAADGSLKVQRAFRWGTLAEFFVLDGRQHRSDQVCGDHVATKRSECPELADEGLTMLGAEQERWLGEGLRGSKATWKVLAQQTVMKALVLGDIVLNVDQWDGYPAARRRLLESIDQAGIDNVVVLTGDIHAGGAADLRTPDAGTTGKVVAHELVGPGISSPGLGAIGAAVDTSSLGLAYANFVDNGYVVCEVTPARWRAEFRVVETVQAETSPASTAATVEIDAGKAGLKRV
jgi:alkaline phosphatase D